MVDGLDGLIDAYRQGWAAGFAGGMLPFDSAYGAARARGASMALSQQEGCAALLDAFCAGLKVALREPHG